MSSSSSSSTRGRSALIGPLTTIFTPPCGPVTTGVGDVSSSCLPPGFVDFYQAGNSLGWYSPGICPSGYTPACAPSSFPNQGDLIEQTETARLCAPFGYSCSDNWDYASSSSSGAPFIEIRWAATDLSTLATDPLTPGRLLPTPTTSTSSISAPPTTTTPATEPTPQGLGSGSVAGIAIGLFLVGLAVGAVALWGFLRRRGKLQSKDDYLYPPHSNITRMSEGPEPDPLQMTQWNPREPPAQMGTVNATGNFPMEAPTQAGSAYQPAAHPSLSPDSETYQPSMPYQSSSSDLQLRNLRKQQAQIQTRRQRLLQLQQLDEEEDEVRRQVAEIEASSRS